MPRKKLETPPPTEERSSRSRKPTEKAKQLAETEKIFSSVLKTKTKKVTPTPAAAATAPATSKSPIVLVKKCATGALQTKNFPTIFTPTTSTPIVPKRVNLPLPLGITSISSKLTPSQVKRSTPPLTKSEPEPALEEKQVSDSECLDELTETTHGRRSTRASVRKNDEKPESLKARKSKKWTKLQKDDTDDSNSIDDFSDRQTPSTEDDEKQSSIQLIIEEDSCSSKSGSQDSGSGPFYGTIPITLELDSQTTQDEIIETSIVTDHDTTDFVEATSSFAGEISMIVATNSRDSTSDQAKAIATLQRLTYNTPEYSIHADRQAAPLKKYPPARSRKVPMPTIFTSKTIKSKSEPPQQIDLQVDEKANIKEINVELSFKSSDGQSSTESRPVEEKIQTKKIQPAPTRKSLRSLRKEPSQDGEPAKKGNTAPEVVIVQPAEKEVEIKEVAADDLIVTLKSTEVDIEMTVAKVEVKEKVEIQIIDEIIVEEVIDTPIPMDTNVVSSPQKEETVETKAEKVDPEAAEEQTSVIEVKETPVPIEIQITDEIVLEEVIQMDLEITPALVPAKKEEPLETKTEEDRTTKRSSSKSKRLENEADQVDPAIKQQQRTGEEVRDMLVPMDTEVVSLTESASKEEQEENNAAKDPISFSQTDKDVVSPPHPANIEKPVEINVTDEVEVKESPATMATETVFEPKPVTKDEPVKTKATDESKTKRSSSKSQRPKDDIKEKAEKVSVLEEKAEKIRKEKKKSEQTSEGSKKEDATRKKKDSEKTQSAVQLSAESRKSKDKSSSRSKSSSDTTKDEKSTLDSRKEKEKPYESSKYSKSASSSSYSHKPKHDYHSEKSYKTLAPKPAAAPPKAHVLKDVDVMKMDEMMMDHRREKDRSRARKLNKEQSTKTKEKTTLSKVEEPKVLPSEEMKKIKESLVTPSSSIKATKLSPIDATKEPPAVVGLKEKLKTSSNRTSSPKTEVKSVAKAEETEVAQKALKDTSAPENPKEEDTVQEIIDLTVDSKPEDETIKSRTKKEKIAVPPKEEPLDKQSLICLNESKSSKKERTKKEKSGKELEKNSKKDKSMQPKKSSKDETVNESVTVDDQTVETQQQLTESEKMTDAISLASFSANKNQEEVDKNDEKSKSRSSSRSSKKGSSHKSQKSKTASNEEPAEFSVENLSAKMEELAQVKDSIPLEVEDLPLETPEPKVAVEEELKPEPGESTPADIDINVITALMSSTLEIVETADGKTSIDYEVIDQIEKLSIAAVKEVDIKEEKPEIHVDLLPADIPMPDESLLHIKPDEEVSKKETIDSMEDINENLRRSSRIKIISSSKQRTVGHGLVRDRDKLLKMCQQLGMSTTDDHNLSINSSHTSEHSSPNTTLDDSGKPMKVKSRWRRSSELEMGLIDDHDEYTPCVDPEPKPLAEEETDPEKIKENERIVDEQLKMFLHVSENIYYCDRNISKETKKMTCDCFLTKEECERGELGCGEDCLNRLLMIECGNRCVVAERCTNKRFQNIQYSQVHVFRTEKKGCGIKATNIILPGDFIMEYVGEVLNSEQFEKRAHEYSKEKNKHYYFMALRSDCIIDATLRGNVSRFINHSCDPNAETQKWTVNGELRIGFFSVRTIMPGEEIVFDYQFQRYGKQAQKCYCEAENCRGWIGEEPDSEESEIEYEEEDYEEEQLESAEKTAIESINEKILLESQANLLPIDDATARKPIEAKPTKKTKDKVPKPDAKAKRSRKIRKDLIDDLGLDEEIDALVDTGLKNQAHTLKLSRLMVRAEAIAVRRRLLNLLLNGELPCRRLFLDYYGLRLLHGWMCGITSTDVFEILKFKLNLLEVLDVLPITNKTMLKDSKVISMVESWVTKKTAGAKKEFFTQITSPANDSSSNSSDTPVVVPAIVSSVKEFDSEFLKNMPNLLKQSAAFVQEMDVDKLKQIMENCDKLKEQEREKELSEAAATPTVENKDVAPKPIDEPPADEENETVLVEKINGLCRKLLASWETLKEVFKIPKKERIEQMKEHEREADMRYKALGLADDDNRSQQRYKSIPSRERRIDSFPQKSSHRTNDTRERHLSKHQRRHLFEVRVAQEEAEKRKQEMWLLHETTCIRFGLNPRQVAPRDIPGMMNVFTEQYYSMDQRPIPTPPSHAFLKFKKPPLSTNPADYVLPPMELPAMWKFGIDERGRIYYYHIKIRISQWEPPIKLLPLTNDDAGQDADESLSDDDTTDDDTSTTDTNDSSEEELEQKLQELQRIKQKRQKLDQSDDVSKTIENLETSMAETDGDDIFGSSFLLEKSMEAIIPSSKRRRRKRDGLVQEKIISARTDEDRAYGQMEMKRYRETKEKLKRRKEEAKRKKAMMLESLASSSQAADKEADDDEEYDAGTSRILDVDDVDDPRNAKVPKKKAIVDELDILRKQKPRKHSNVYEEWKKQELKMKLEKRKSASKSSSKAAKRAKMSDALGSIDYNSEEARKIKDKFRVAIASVIVQHLGPYRKETCEIGQITNNEDFKHLARKLTHFVMLKELKHCHNTIRDLVVTDSVKTKAREFIKKYMAKYGPIYVRGENEPDFKD